MVEATRAPDTRSDDDGRSPVHAFLIVDVRGYTHFTEEHGDEAAARLVERFEQLVRDAVAAHDGSVVEVRGDEVLAVFRSPRRAVTAAADLQRRSVEDARSHRDAPIPLGIGLDVGEAVAVRDGFRGGALNLASRLCAEAGPGETLASPAIVHLARKVEDVRFVDRGALHLKGLSDPVPTHAVVADGIDTAAEISTLAPDVGTERHRPVRLRFRILGPIEVEAAGEVLSLGGPKQRTVLASLILGANEVVPVDALTETVWGEEPPATARNTIQTYVSQLRKAVGHDRLQAQPPGYRIRVDPSELDATRFERLLADARRTRPTAPGTSAAMLEEALALWRGSALSGVADGSLVSEIARLTELRSVAEEDLVDDLLAVGQHARVIGQLEAFLGREPLRERAWGQLMLALYRDGRQADALAAFQRARGVLADELGIDPSPELARLHERILRHDPDLEARGEPLRGYRLLERIGEGPAGTVFRAIQPHVGRDVVVKVFSEAIASDPLFVRRFEQESRAVLALEHPHLTPVYDAWREPAGAYVVSRFLRGGSLQALMAQGPLSRERAERIVEQVGSALSFAHRSGVAHGNVSASNVLLDQEGNAYLGDFRVGVGVPPDQAEDRRELLALADDLLRGHRTGLDALIERAERLGQPPSADEVAVAAKGADGDAFPDAAPGDERNPFKGLRAFTEADAADFFGRGALIERVLERMRGTKQGSRFVALVGPSGSGKSSVVRAGVVPAIRRGELGSSDVLVAEMFPGQHPTEELEASLLRIAVGPSVRLRDRLESGPRGLLEAVDAVVPGTTDVVLVVDQLEEVFTLTDDERERDRFLESLRVAALDPESRVRVIVTLRADFYDRPLVYGRFGELLANSTEPVTALSADELEQAIRAPAEAVGLRPEPGLVAEMIAAAADQPGALPLVQYALTELFDRRSEGRLSLDAYREIGGVAGALSVRADRLFEGADAEGRRAITQLFLRLVTLGEGRQDTRRRVPRRELDSLDLDEEALTNAIESFGRHRLLTFDREPATREPTVEIAHEALLTAWARLRRWIDETRQDLRQERALASASAEWRSADRDPGFLLHGSRLEQFESWAEGTQLSIAAGERELLRASAEQRDRERAAELERRSKEERLERRSIRRLRALVALAAASALVAFTLTAVAVNQRDRAETETRFSSARELAAASVANLRVDPELSVLLAMEAIDRTHSVDGFVLPEAEDALHQAIRANRLESTVRGVGEQVAWGAGGRFGVESVETPGTIEIHDGRTGAALFAFDAHNDDVTGLAFSRDGTMLATTGVDGELNVWNASSGELFSKVQGEGLVEAPAFDATGSRVAAVWLGERRVQIAVPLTGRVISAHEIPAASPGTTVISPDLHRVAYSHQERTFVRDLRTHRRTELGDGGTLASWSPDGRYLALGTLGVVDILDASTLRYRFDVKTNEATYGLDWTSDARRIIVGGDTTAQLWAIDEEGAQEVMTLYPNAAGRVAVATISPDGSRVITGDTDTPVVKVWDVSIFGDAEVANVPATPNFADVAFMPSGHQVAVQLAPGDDPSITIWDLAQQRSVRQIGPPRLYYGWNQGQFEVSPDGTAIASLFGDGSADVRDAGSNDELFAVPDSDLITWVDWSPDGSQVVMSSLHGWVKFLDRAGRELRIFREPRGLPVWSAIFTPDGRSLVMDTAAWPPFLGQSDLEGRTTVWDVERGAVVRTIEKAGSTWSAMSPDGYRHATIDTSPEGPAEVWNLKNGARVSLLVHSGMVNTAFGPGGQVAGAMLDATVRLYDAATGEQQLVLRGHENAVAFVDFSPDGTMLISGAADGVARVWALDIDLLLDIARDEVTRSLTVTECREHHVERCS